MDIKLTDSSIRYFLDTDATSDDLSCLVSLCGPTFDRVHRVADDYVYEIEAITNRIDTASAYGVAREAVAILSRSGCASKLINDPYKSTVTLTETTDFPIKIDISSPKLTPRFLMAIIRNVKVGESPESVKTLLNNCDQRPLNNLIDITNELTLLYGIPSHIFDLDKIRGNLKLRLSNPNEIITTLDDKKHTLTGDDIVIEDNSGLIDLCGIMGGSQSVVDNNTQNLLLLIPIYSPKHIRKTSLAQQKRTLAAQIYEKSPDCELALPVLQRACELFTERAGATPVTEYFDYYPARRQQQKFVELDTNWLNHFIGIDIDKKEIISILSDLGFTGHEEGETRLSVSIPSFRHDDINIREDLAEEVARVYGYYRLPKILPTTTLPPESPNQLLETEKHLRSSLVGFGFHEILNSSLTSHTTLEKAGLTLSDHLKLNNALSEDSEYMRTTLLPSLLENYLANITVNPLNIFEIASVYLTIPNEQLPEERSTLALLSTSDYHTFKGHLESLLRHSLVTFTRDLTPSPLFKPSETALIKSAHTVLGRIGVIHPEVALHFGVPETIFLAEISIPEIVNTSVIPNITDTYPFPPVFDDVTIDSPLDIDSLVSNIRSASPLITSIEYLSSYNTKHSFRLTFNSRENALTKSETDAIKSSLV